MSDIALPDFSTHAKNAKLRLLTQDDFRAEPRHSIFRFIRTFITERGLDTDAVRILDLGCGRGRSVGALRARGYRAFGVDIEPQFIAAGAIVDREFSDTTAILSRTNEDGTLPFPDGFFDIVVSDQVLEHVAELDLFARETARVLKRGGGFLHIYPASRRVVEPHYFIPVAHWLPKTAVRRWYVRAMVGLGFASGYFPHLSKRDRAEVIFRYSVEQTYYRSRAEIRRVFATRGLRADHERYPEALLRESRLAALVPGRAARHAAANLLGLFGTAYCLGTKDG